MDEDRAAAFTYQKPDEKQIAQIENVRIALAYAYGVVLKNVPASAERTLAIRKLEEASMWSNKAIAFGGARYLDG